jgi:hypothetical protein
MSYHINAGTDAQKTARENAYLVTQSRLTDFEREGTARRIRYAESRKCLKHNYPTCAEYVPNTGIKRIL